MHTAICSFEDRASAEQAVERLTRAGFSRRDIHLTHRHADGSEVKQAANDTWDTLEREVAVDPKLVQKLGDFFDMLFGKDDPDGHVDTYSGAVDHGHYVVAVDGQDDLEGERAQSVLHGLDRKAANMAVVHRANLPPLRDIVGERPAASGAEPRFSAVRGEMPSVQRDRASAAADPGAWGEQRPLDLRDPDRGTDKPGR